MNLSEFVEKYGDIAVDEEQLAKTLGVKREYIKHGADYWVVGLEGIFMSTWYNDSVDRVRLRTGMAFRTEQEAQRFFERGIMYEKLLGMARIARWEHNFTIGSDQGFYIYYCYDDAKLAISPTQIFAHVGDILFPTRASAQNAIDAIGADAIINTLFKE